MKYLTSISNKVLGLIAFPDSIIKSRELKLFLIISFSILFVAIAILIFGFFGYSYFLTSVLTISFSCLIISVLLSTRFFNWPLLLFLIVILGLFYKRLHWPFAVLLMTLGTILLGIVCLFNSGKFSYDFRNNTFLKWFGFITGIIVSLFMAGLLCMNLHLPGRAIMIYSGCFLFILCVNSMVFTMPFSNYVGWSDIERKVFFKTVLVPMLFIFAFFILVFVFPDVYNSLMGRGVHEAPWSWSQPVFFNLEGIPDI